jgi:hypothetical protein
MLTAREIEPSDRPLLDAAAKADSFHRAAGLTGKHWEKGIFYEDEEGPVVALTTTSVARVDIQFLCLDRQRNRNALLNGFVAFVRALEARGVQEIIFSTQSHSVARFMEKRFKFRHLGGNQYSLRIRT